METLESIGTFLAGLGILFAELSGTIFLLASTERVTQHTKAIKKEEKQWFVLHMLTNSLGQVQPNTNPRVARG